MQSIVDRNEAGKIPAELRMQLLARAMEVYCWLDFFGVDQHDFALRNIMASPDQKRVVLLDFSHSIVRDLPNSRWTSLYESGPHLPPSPIQMFQASFGSSMGGWIPGSLQVEKAQIEWLKEQWEGSRVFAPVRDKLAERLGIENSN